MYWLAKLTGHPASRTRTTPMKEHLLSIKQVADFLNMSERSVYRLARDRKIPAVKIASSWRVPQKELRAWIAAKLREKEPA